MSVEWIHFPELEHLYKNVFTASFPKRSVRNVGCSFVSKKRTRSGSNVSSRVGKDQRSIHFTSLLDDLKSSKDYCPRNLFSGSNSSPEKSSPEKSSRFLPRKSVLRPALAPSGEGNSTMLLAHIQSNPLGERRRRLSFFWSGLILIRDQEIRLNILMYCEDTQYYWVGVKCCKVPMGCQSLLESLPTSWVLTVMDDH